MANLLKGLIKIRGVSSKVSLSGVLVLLTTLTLLALAACFPSATAPIPDSAEPAAQSGAAAPAPTASPLPTAVLQTPTLEPTASPKVQTREEPTAVIESNPATADESESSAASSAIFDDLPLLEERAFSYLSKLAVDLGVRTSGTDLEAEAADFVAQRFEELGYEPELQEFTWDSPTAAFNLVAPEPETLDANILTGTPGGEATGEMVFVGLARPADLPDEGLEGKIALIERGEITFGSKVTAVHNAGAVAAVIYNNVPGSFSGTLGGRSEIPAIALSQADGRRLKELLEQGATVASTVSVQDNAVPSRNVIAELPGTDEGVVIVGAHYDTVPDSIGASDNSSGMGALLAVAERVADRSFPFTLRFIAFGSEETGLHGSEHYVESLSTEELEEIYLMVNLDSVGSGSHLRVSGDRWVTNHVIAAGQRENLPIIGRAGTARGSSDHLPFRDAWVPIIYFQANDLQRINSPADTMEHINTKLLGAATALVLDLLENAAQLPGYGQ